MKILIADSLAPNVTKTLSAANFDHLVDPSLKEQTLVDALKSTQADVLVVRSTKVTGSMIEAAPKLRLIIRAGAGVNTIDVETASRLGVFVGNCPGKNAKAVAELTFGLLIAADRRIADNTVALRKGEWNKKEFSKARGLAGRTLGIVGFGHIGQEVAMRAKAFEMDVLVSSRSLTEAAAKTLGIRRAGSLQELVTMADIISLHVAYTPETKGMCNQEFFSWMKEGAIFINTSRGEIVEEEALIKACETKRIRAGLDVFLKEPEVGQQDWKSTLASHPQVVGTHHIAASTEQAEAAIGAEVIRLIREFNATGNIETCVNLDPHAPATHLLSVRHLNRVGVLARVLDILQRAGINVLDMENRIFSGDDAAVALIRLGSPAEAAVITELQDCSAAIISVTINPLKE
ncbi:hydroxyacid dehydrogenase [bacterium]|nr:hydroxyacid dehydrogenase [bacterium]